MTDLRKLVEAAIGEGFGSYARQKLREALSPIRILALLDELDALKEKLVVEEKRWDDLADLADGYWKDKRTAEHNLEQVARELDRLKAQ